MRCLLLSVSFFWAVSCGMGTMTVSGVPASSTSSGGGIFSDPTTRTLPGNTEVASALMRSPVFVAHIKSDVLFYSAPTQSQVFEMEDSFHELNLRIVEQLLETQ